MDIERAVIRSLFYDFQITDIVHFLESDLNNQSKKSAFESIFTEMPVLLKNQMNVMTLGETRLISDMLKKQWNEGAYASKQKAAQPFLYLSEICNKLLDTNSASNIPSIKQDQLLRWRELSLLIGEELPVCAFLAGADKSNRTNFLWQDVLSYKIRTKLSEKCDIHAHMDASSNAYEIGWIYRMNHPSDNSKKTTDHDSQVEVWLAIAMAIRYWLYLLVTKEEYPTEERQRQLLNAFSDNDEMHSLQNITIEGIRGYRLDSVQTNEPNIKYWDYASTDEKMSVGDKSKPEILFTGERTLIYTYLRKLFASKNKESDISRFSGYFYLYCILKVNFRKRLVQTNGQIGLANYQTYQSQMHTMSDCLKNLRWRYAILSSKGESGNDGIEARIPFDNEDKLIGTANINASKSLSIDSHDIIYMPYQGDGVSLVISITKPKAHSLRNLRKCIAKTKNDIDLIMGKCYGYKMNGIPLMGFDIAGSDTNCRPKHIKPIIEALRKRGCNNITYHAGEDFHDLLDGLRTIHEILFDLEWKAPNRLAHLSALYTDARTYYNNRKGNMVMPAKVLYDNLKWFISQSAVLSKRLNVELNKEIKNLETSFKGIEKEEPEEGEFHRVNEIVVWHLKPTNRFIDAIECIQKSLRDEIQKRKIHVESCPTSNYHIGYFEKYDETPFCQMARNYTHQQYLNASINTDARAIFATSLDNEYALTETALKKAGMVEDKVDEILRMAAKKSNDNRFRVEKEGIRL